MFDKELIQKIREEMYLGKGYSVIRSYLPPAEAVRMREFWRTHSSRPITEVNKGLQFYRGCPNYSLRLPGQIQIHFNFFWNPPLDEKTSALCWQVNLFRNVLEGRPLETDFMPTLDPSDQRLHACCYRVVIQRSRHGVPPHCDWKEEPFRIQTSLQLSEWGVDYEAGGLRITTNPGREINVCKEECLRPGDLLIFRYSNIHAVEEARTTGNQIGYARIIFTAPPIEPAPPSRSLLVRHELRQFVNRIRGIRNRNVTDEYPAVIPSKAGVANSPEPLPEDPLKELKDAALREGIEPCRIYQTRGLFAGQEKEQERQIAYDERGVR